VADWHAVYTVYCDGSSATSARDDSPIPTPGGSPIWLRGFDVLQAWLEELELLGGLLSNATDVVLTGTSAGGMATYIHSDFIRSKVGERATSSSNHSTPPSARRCDPHSPSQLPPAASVVAAPDAGYFMCVEDQ
jgi:hypothetical protein